MNEQPWSQLGIPPHSRFEQFLYNQPADTLIVRLLRRDQSSSYEELYVRRSAESIYKPLPLPSGYVYRSVFVSATTPDLFGLQWRKQPDGDDWIGMLRVDLNDMSYSSLVDIGVPSAARRRWIASLHGSTADGQRVFCVVATETLASERSFKVTYELCSLDLRSTSLAVIAELKGGFL